MNATSLNTFALLDDCAATDATRSSRLYTDFSHERSCAGPGEFDRLCTEVDADLRAGFHAIVLGDYEWGAHLHIGRPLSAHEGVSENKKHPFRYLLFRKMVRLSGDEVSTWLAEQDNVDSSPSAAGVMKVTPSISRDEFDEAISHIHAALKAGESYQVNYTYRLNFSAFGLPVALYRRLRDRQPVRFGALIALPDDAWILSCSPELFIEHTAGHLVARPMKGTAPRSTDETTDKLTATDLAASSKNRAENLMIVDLLRNDFGRVAQTGSVHVPALFSVEPYATVWQMTSTIAATLDANTRFETLIRALIPCGSITGAPKHATIKLIEKLENTPRGIYTGAIGWLDAPDMQRSCGDFCLSVAIRTLMLGVPREDGMRQGEMGVGAGIVLDSRAEDEYKECQLKASFLTAASPGFVLIETTYATLENGIRNIDHHLLRLANSARVFDFHYDETRLRAMLNEKCNELPANSPHRLRLALDKDGHVDIITKAFLPLITPVTLLLAPDVGLESVNSRDVLTHHKTTSRSLQDRAWQTAEQRGAFDVLLFNESGELTEGGRCNIFLKLNGRWYTPPLRCGVLPGVMRTVILNEINWNAEERVITREDLIQAEELMACNALHGALHARLG